MAAYSVRDESAHPIGRAPRRADYPARMTGRVPFKTLRQTCSQHPANLPFSSSSLQGVIWIPAV